MSTNAAACSMIERMTPRNGLKVLLFFKYRKGRALIGTCGTCVNKIAMSFAQDAERDSHTISNFRADPIWSRIQNYSPLKKQHFGCHTSWHMRGTGEEGYLICAACDAAVYQVIFCILTRKFVREYSCDCATVSFKRRLEREMCDQAVSFPRALQEGAESVHSIENSLKRAES
jgi:hypothetical protein